MPSAIQQNLSELPARTLLFTETVVKYCSSSAEGCDRLFQEKASGKSVKNRPELEKAINALGTGDVLVLAEWDRCTRSMIDGVAIIERINASGARAKVLDKPHLDLTTPLGRASWPS